MNSQFNTDARIDQVLDALRTTEPPTGLEQRIAARLAQAAEARTLAAASDSAPSYLSGILTLSLPKLYSAAALVLLTALTAFTVAHHHSAVAANGPTYMQSRVPHLRDGIIVAKVGIAPSATALPSLEAARLQSRHNAPPTNSALAAETTSPPSPSAQDPEAIALAETLAPSHPAPPMPVTAQEKLIHSAMRPGQPIQLAELDLARAPILRAAAQTRETASIDRYVKTLLAPFAVADALQPTTQSQPQDAPMSAPAEPTSNPSN